MRTKWIKGINLTSRHLGLTYSQVVGALHKTGLGINRKVLFQVATGHHYHFSELIKFTSSVNEPVNQH
jgi:large subunit ribosomal protein L20